MKLNFNTLLILSISAFLFTVKSANSQVLQVTYQITPEEMVEMLIGSGLEYDNVVFTGADISRGSFWNGPGNIGISNGIILTSGSVDVAPGPNNNSGAGYVNSTGGDPDITTLAGSSSYDACVLEFDFVPYFSHVWFQFVFGSEEYPEYVGAGFNDVFGFFISGPGISGSYTNNAENIALIPGTSVPVSINNVNASTNPAYYVENTGNFIQYDGFTTVLTAESDVVPMSTYHIKLAVGDVLDHVYDSGVLLQASSFCSGPVSGVKTNDPGSKTGNFSIYPVPAGDRLTIAARNGQHFQIQLVSQEGNVCRSMQGNSTLTLDISDIPTGIYILKIFSETGVETTKIFKR